MADEKQLEMDNGGGKKKKMLIIIIAVVVLLAAVALHSFSYLEMMPQQTHKLTQH